MEKQKMNANAVGATSSRPHFEGKAKKQKGITLIALIITIIVMLILVGVTVATISDGGLFKKAKTATEQTEEKAIYEQLVGAMKIGTDGKIDVKATYNAAKTALESQGKTVALKSPSAVEEITNSATIEVTGKNGKAYTYTITTEKIMSGEFKFYGYGYYFADAGEEGGAYYYFLENGIIVLDYNGMIYSGGKFEKKDNYIIPNGDEESKILFSNDYSQLIQNGEVMAIRDDNEVFKNKGISDPTYKIYINGIYCMENNENFFSVMADEEGNKMILDYAQGELNQIDFNNFIANVEVLEEGKTVKYNNEKYYLLERIR